MWTEQVKTRAIQRVHQNAPLVGDVTLTQTFGVPASVVATGIDVQQGAKQRSYVNLVNVAFADAAALAGWYSAA